MWIRILDPVAALAARRFAVDVGLVLEVHDPQFGKSRVRLDGSPQGAFCSTTTAEPDVVLGSAALGSLYLGGHRAHTLAHAGLIEGPGVSLLDAALVADRPPMHGTGFRGRARRSGHQRGYGPARPGRRVVDAQG